MPKRSADLAAFTVTKPQAVLPSLAVEEAGAEREHQPEGRRTLIKKSLQMTPEAARQLLMLKAETGKKEHELLSEALNLLFKKNGKPQLA